MGYCKNHIAATHHTGCECWEAARDAIIARLTRERDEARRDLYRVADALDCTIDADGVGSIAAPIDEVVQAARDAARAAQERDEARAEVERLRAVVDTVAAEVAATLEAYRGGQSAGSPPLPLSVAQRWARTLASAETEEER